MGERRAQAGTLSSLQHRAWRSFRTSKTTGHKMLMKGNYTVAELDAPTLEAERVFLVYVLQMVFGLTSTY